MHSVVKICFAILLPCLINSCSRNSFNPDKPTDRNGNFYRIVSYNVENLFDTYDEPYKLDDDFTPEGANRWTKYRLNKKIVDLGKVLVNAAGNEVPAVIGLMEVENADVLESLLRYSPLKKFKYKIIHEESPDERGIDVALLYDSDQFTYLNYQIGRIEFPFDAEDQTRDILMVKGVFGKRDTVYFAVNHWPSRRGGVAETEPKRVFVANQLKEKVEGILKKQPNAGVIMMGDFNDDSNNKSIREALKAGDWDEQDNFDYIDLLASRSKKGLGTYKYRDQWNMLDHFIITKNLTDDVGRLYIDESSVRIFAPDWLKEEDPNFPGNRIFRTYRGPQYVGGISDHFPLVLDVWVR